MQSAVQEEALQKKGVVVIFNFVGKKARPVSLNLVRTIYRYRLAVPHRLEAVHYCFDNKKLRPFVSGLRLFMGSRARMRSRVHYSPDFQTVIFQLQTFGIPVSDDSPLRQVDGDFPLTWHEEWLQLRQAQEQELDGKADDEPARILIPHRFDVLFGRGAKVSTHTGNLRALHLVNMWQSKYDGACNRFAKAGISERIVSIIHESGGRFLKWDEVGGWSVADDETARDKISHWFRNQRRSKPDKNNTREETKAQKRTRSAKE